MVPLTIGLLCATAWILVQPSRASLHQAAGAAALMALTVLLMRRTRWTPLVPMAIGALVGGAGFA
jgi:chromate transporter